jgi:hypothetical protein
MSAYLASAKEGSYRRRSLKGRNTESSPSIENIFFTFDIILSLECPQRLEYKSTGAK